MKEKLENLARRRLQRGSFVRNSKKLAIKHQGKLLTEVLPLLTHKERDPWDTSTTNITIRTSVPGIVPGDNQSDDVKRSLTLATIVENHPEEAWIHVYTDGSATNAVSDGGAGVNIVYPDGNRSAICLPTGKFCSNYAAEVKALERAAEEIADSAIDCQQVVFFTDALSVLQALPSDSLEQLSASLGRVSDSRRTVLQWVPAHCGLPGNELADQLAKLGASAPQSNNTVSHREMKTLIKAVNAPPPLKDDLNLLSRQDQVIIFRLRTEHNRLNKHMHHKLRIATSPLCPCGEAPQTGKHILQDCSRYQQLRRSTWASDTPLQAKLYGPVTELERTAQFIVETGLLL